MATQPSPPTWLLAAKSPFRMLIRVHSPQNEVLGGIWIALLAMQVG
jgi:hypothetical protein